MQQLPQEIIRQKRDGAALSASAIEEFVQGITSSAVCNEQIAALTMAIFIRGMNDQEQAALTRAMTHSGEVLDWSSQKLHGPVVDKHSTGGVGDKVSLMLAPIVAACGAHVPMISGRGLGHTGGTLDKLDCIPGYVSTPDLERFMRITREVGCSIIGQTASLAPADKKIYAVRDISGTVESIPLITASILSKKLAAGLDALVMDVKFGNGAFMAEFSQARALARNLIQVAGAAGLPTSALITDMNQVLGHSVGHSVEILETIDFLAGKQEARLLECTLALAAEMLRLGGLAQDAESGRSMAQEALNSGHAAEVFQRMVVAHGGPADLLEQPQRHFAAAPVVVPVYPQQAGYLSGFNARAVGTLVARIGGGRVRVDQDIDPRVGLTQVASLGDWVDHEHPLALLHAADEASAELARQELTGLAQLSDARQQLAPVVAEVLAARP